MYAAIITRTHFDNYVGQIMLIVPTGKRDYVLHPICATTPFVDLDHLRSTLQEWIKDVQHFVRFFKHPVARPHVLGTAIMYSEVWRANRIFFRERAR